MIILFTHESITFYYTNHITLIYVRIITSVIEINVPFQTNLFTKYIFTILLNYRIYNITRFKSIFI